MNSSVYEINSILLNNWPAIVLYARYYSLYSYFWFNNEQVSSNSLINQVEQTQWWSNYSKCNNQYLQLLKSTKNNIWTRKTISDDNVELLPILCKLANNLRKFQSGYKRNHCQHDDEWQRWKKARNSSKAKFVILQSKSVPTRNSHMSKWQLKWHHFWRIKTLTKRSRWKQMNINWYNQRDWKRTGATNWRVRRRVLQHY